MRRMPVPPRKDPLADPFAKRFSLDGREIWDPITGETELVRRCVWPGFRGAFTEYLELTSGMAVALKELEVGLRDAGLVTSDEELVQLAGSPSKFRVKRKSVSDDRIHDGSSSRFFVRRAAPSEPVPVLIEDHSPEPQSGGVPVKGLSEASLDGVRDGITTTDGCGGLPIDRRNGEDLI